MTARATWFRRKPKDWSTVQPVTSEFRFGESRQSEAPHEQMN